MDNKESFTKQENKTINRLGIRKIIALQKECISLYNTVCDKCRTKMVLNPKRKFEDYCLNCQPLIKEKLERFQYDR